MLNNTNKSTANNMKPIAPAPVQPASQESSSQHHPMAGSTDIPRTKRTRAKRSCDLCRKKKTRCDSSVNFPCTKCRLAKSECRFLTEQKKRGPAPRSYVGILEDRLQRMEKLLEKVSKKKGTDDTHSYIYQQQQQQQQQQQRLSSLPLTESDGHSASEDDIIIPSYMNQPSPKDDGSGEEHRGHDMYSSQYDRRSASITPKNKDIDTDPYEDSSPNSPCILFEQENEDEQALNGDSKDTRDSPVASMERQLRSLTINDYQRTRYIGSSSGVHLLNDKFMASNKKHRLEDDTSWFVQKLNRDKEEHVIVKTQEVDAIIPNEKLENRAELPYFKDVPYITRTFLDHIVKMFFTYNQRFCPFINRVQFLEQYYYQTPCPPDKYLLYAIIYVSVTVFQENIEKSKILELTPEQWSEIQRIMKDKAYHLLGIVYKRSMISTVQALMILSMFASYNCNDDEETSHWFITGMAIRTAQDLGLHRDCSKWCIPEYEKELRRRIWYNAYMMDRWVAAELGRPLSILDHEFDVAVPSPYELDYQPIVDFAEHETPELILETQEALREKRPVYIAFTSLVTLTRIFGEVLHTFYLTDKAKENRYRNIELLNLYDKKLAQWKSSLPEELQLDVNKLHEAKRPNHAKILAVIVNMIYGAILLLLFRPYIQKQDETSTSRSELACRALSICTAAAVNILTIAESVGAENLVVLPWKMSIYALFQAAIIFLHNTKGANDVIKEQGREYLMRCSKVYLCHSYLSQAKPIRVLQFLVENFDVSMKDAPGAENNGKKEDNTSWNHLFAMTKGPPPKQQIGYQSTPSSPTECAATASTINSPTSSQTRNKASFGGDQGAVLPNDNNQNYNMLAGADWVADNHTNSTVENMSENMLLSAANTNGGLMNFSLGQHVGDSLQNNGSSMAYNNWLNGEPYNQTFTNSPTSAVQTEAQPAAPVPPIPTSFPSTSSNSTTYNLSNPFMLSTINNSVMDPVSSQPFFENLNQCHHETLGMNIPHYHQDIVFNTNHSTSSQQQQPHAQAQPFQLDLTCLASQVPLWELPSGGTWNDWETFIRNSQSHTQQPPPQ